jgi:asparagine synthase (glutamine-hydrolysing)
MCGIAGVAAEVALPKHVDIVTRMCDSLRHRGPDDRGLYTGRSCVLGHTRLSIIDVSGGHQPLSNEDGTIWVVFNGEIYNYVELRQELMLRGHEFAASTDTEVIVHLYEDLGIKLVERLNGMFAFALYDANSESLFLVRDRLGIKPLYYSEHHGRLIFGSEMKALLEDPDLPLEIDREAIAEYMTLSYIPDPKTPFRKIKKLPPGSYIEYNRKKLVETKYWRIPTGHDGSAGSLDDICEQIVFLIQDATRLQLRSDVPVGLFASGGIDSTAIMWGAFQQNISLDAFLVEFDHLKIDTPYARIAAAATGMNLVEQHLSAVEAGELLPKLIWHLDEPLADPAVVPCYLVARHAADKVKVILNGTGGDELFGGYPRYNVRGLIPGSWSALAGGFLSRFSAINSWVDKLAALLDYRHRYFRRLGVFRESQVRSALGLKGRGSVKERVSNLFEESVRNDGPGSMMFVDTNLYLPGDLFMLLDKMTMAVSLEARVPLLDHRLVEFVSTIPGHLKMRGKELKWLLRRALRGRVPDEILDRPKQGFGPPVSKWLEEDLGSQALKVVTRKSAGLSHLFGREWVSSLMTGTGPRTNGFAARVWTLLVLELWMQVFVNGKNISDVSVEQLSQAGGSY